MTDPHEALVREGVRQMTDRLTDEQLRDFRLGRPTVGRTALIRQLASELLALRPRVEQLEAALRLIEDHCQDGSHISKQILKIINAAPREQSASKSDEGAAQKPKLTDEAARKWRELDGEYQEWLNRGR